MWSTLIITFVAATSLTRATLICEYFDAKNVSCSNASDARCVIERQCPPPPVPNAAKRSAMVGSDACMAVYSEGQVNRRQLRTFRRYIYH